MIWFLQPRMPLEAALRHTAAELADIRWVDYEIIYRGLTPADYFTALFQQHGVEVVDGTVSKKQLKALVKSIRQTKV